MVTVVVDAVCPLLRGDLGAAVDRAVVRQCVLEIFTFLRMGGAIDRIEAGHSPLHWVLLLLLRFMRAYYC